MITLIESWKSKAQAPLEPILLQEALPRQHGLASSPAHHASAWGRELMACMPQDCCSSSSAGSSARFGAFLAPVKLISCCIGLILQSTNMVQSLHQAGLCRTVGNGLVCHLGVISCFRTQLSHLLGCICWQWSRARVIAWAPNAGVCMTTSAGTSGKSPKPLLPLNEPVWRGAGWWLPMQGAPSMRWSRGSGPT